MNIVIDKIRPQEFKKYEDDAHTIVFGERRPHGLSTHHFVLMMCKDGEVGGFCTAIEMDKHTLYLQYGGVFPNFANSLYVFMGFQKMIAWTSKHYKQVWARIDQNNFTMLKMANKVGFDVCGTWTFDGRTYLEMINKF